MRITTHAALTIRRKSWGEINPLNPHGAKQPGDTAGFDEPMRFRDGSALRLEAVRLP
jgi:hypothetical protein